MSTETVSLDVSSNPLNDMDDLDSLRLKQSSESSSDHVYRDYDSEARSTVREFYRLNHTYQTFDFVVGKKQQYRPGLHAERQMSIWEAMEFLNTLVDDSDPDTNLTQIEHLMQTSEAIRADGHPDWFVLTGLIHDLGKILCLFGEPQWAVVGDTFPVGCAYSDKIVYQQFLQLNADSKNPAYQTELGVYSRNCGLGNVHLSWGHDEYLYQVVKNYLPAEALAMIRYHSFYPAHTGGAYRYLMNTQDESIFEWVRKFNPYDLYSKTPVRPDVSALKPYYLDLISKFFPEKISW